MSMMNLTICLRKLNSPCFCAGFFSIYSSDIIAVSEGDDMKEIVLNFLRESKDYVSGENISGKLNISRTAVWKYIKKLKDEGYNIESSTKKGYRLIESPDILTTEEIDPLLKTKYIGRKIKYFESINSTNDLAKKLASEGADEGTIIIAEEQTKGKGRLGRKWHTEPFKSVAMSIILRPRIIPQLAPSITPILAVSIVEVLRGITGFDIKIKWPNDVVLDHKKLCGILTEMNAEIDAVNYIIIGMGLNINQEITNEDIKDIAISLKNYSGIDFDRRNITALILNRFEENYEEFKKSGLINFIEKLKEYSVLLGKRVVVSGINEKVEGEAVDIDASGNLIIKLDTGENKKILSGDVSVRGLYGYTPM